MAPMIDEGLLEDVARLERLDTRQALRGLATAGAQVRETMGMAVEAGIDRTNSGDRPRSVLVASLGGSAVVSDVLDVLAEPGSPVPLTARRALPLPGWVGPMDLVIAVSLSGRAAGPLGLAAEAARRGAGLLTVGAPDSPLADVCARGRGVHVPVPLGLTSSRTALWSLITPVLMAAHRLGLADVPDEVLAGAADRLDEQAEACRPASEAFVNPAKSLALDLAPTVPVVLGDGPLMGVAASRAASMLARTARMPASWGELPDAASQIVACFDGPFTAGGGVGVDVPNDNGAGIFADPFLDGPATPRLGLVMVRDVLPEDPEPDELEANTIAEAVGEAARDAGLTVRELVTEPGAPIERLAGVIALTDFTATYLALGLGLDPAVSPHVADLRDRTDS